MTYPYPPVPQPPAPEPRRSWFARHKILTALGALLLLFVVIAVASGGGGSKPAADATPTPGTPAVSTTRSTSPTPSRTPTPTDSKTPPTSAPATPAVAEYSDGDYVVGEDIPAGTYTSEGATPGAFEFCMISTDPTDSETWPQLKSANANERIIITLSKADSVVTISGCEPLKAR